MTTKRIRTYLFPIKNIKFQNSQDVDCLPWRNFLFKLVEKWSDFLSKNLPSRNEFARNFPRKIISEFLVKQSCFYKHSQWTTAKTQSRHPIPRDTKETSSGNKKHILSRDSEAILQILPQSLVARDTTGKDFLILRHFSLWVVGRDRIDSISDKYEDHIFACSIFEVFGGTCRWTRSCSWS